MFAILNNKLFLTWLLALLFFHRTRLKREKEFVYNYLILIILLFYLRVPSQSKLKMAGS
jgi:hypothetical protein